MTAYRDQYASLFHDGRNVVLIGISNDSPESLHSWLKDADFPFLFASNEADPGSVYEKYGGGLRESGTVDSRTVIVVGPDGRVAGVIPQFRQVDPQAYTELGAMIDKVTPEPEGDQAEASAQPPDGRRVTVMAKSEPGSYVLQPSLTASSNTYWMR